MFDVDEKNISQFKETRLSSPQAKNIRYKFIIDQSEEEKNEYVKMIVEQLETLEIIYFNKNNNYNNIFIFI